MEFTDDTCHCAQCTPHANSAVTAAAATAQTAAMTMPAPGIRSG